MSQEIIVIYSIMKLYNQFIVAKIYYNSTSSDNNNDTNERKDTYYYYYYYYYLLCTNILVLNLYSLQHTFAG